MPKSHKLRDFNFCDIHIAIRESEYAVDVSWKLSNITPQFLSDFLKYAITDGENKYKVDYRTLKNMPPAELIQICGEDAYNKPLKLPKKNYPQQYSFKEIHKAIKETDCVSEAAVKLNIRQNTLSEYLIKIVKLNPDLNYENLKILSEQQLEAALGLIYNQSWIILENTVIYQDADLQMPPQFPSIKYYDDSYVIDTLDKLMDIYTPTLITNKNTKHKHPREYAFNDIHKAIKKARSLTQVAADLNVCHATLINYLKEIARINPDLSYKNLKRYKEDELENHLGPLYKHCWVVYENTIIYENTALDTLTQPSSTPTYETNVSSTLALVTDNSNKKPRKYPRECPFNEIHKAIKDTGSIIQAAIELNVANSTLQYYLKKIATINPNLTYQNLKRYEEDELENALGPIYRKYWIIRKNTIIYENSALYLTTQPSAALDKNHTDMNDTLAQNLDDYALPFTTGVDENFDDIVVQTDSPTNVVENLSELMNIYELLPPIVDDNEEFDSLLKGFQNVEEDAGSSLPQSVTTNYANNQTNKRVIQACMPNHVNSNLFQKNSACLPSSLLEQPSSNSADELPVKRSRLSALATHSLFTNSQLPSDTNTSSNCKQVEKSSRSNKPS
ncbi:Uncharacterised protein [Legionella busanensis]|uniref:Uncharacterized protein n=1 Tax=Legionella busanensis TaxID=190655 RepID=A0A378JLK5_9GAMM|nr:hypothetical protein [Legionella busanensis]STX52094.1 Uncharacterised protein [Legionella busanensis]